MVQLEAALAATTSPRSGPPPPCSTPSWPDCRPPTEPRSRRRPTHLLIQAYPFLMAAPTSPARQAGSPAGRPGASTSSESTGSGSSGGSGPSGGRPRADVPHRRRSPSTAAVAPPMTTRLEPPARRRGPERHHVGIDRRPDTGVVRRRRRAPPPLPTTTNRATTGRMTAGRMTTGLDVESSTIVPRHPPATRRRHHGVGVHSRSSTPLRDQPLGALDRQRAPVTPRSPSAATMASGADTRPSTTARVTGGRAAGRPGGAEPEHPGQGPGHEQVGPDVETDQESEGVGWGPGGQQGGGGQVVDHHAATAANAAVAGAPRWAEDRGGPVHERPNVPSATARPNSPTRTGTPSTSADVVDPLPPVDDPGRDRPDPDHRHRHAPGSRSTTTQTTATTTAATPSPTTIGLAEIVPAGCRRAQLPVVDHADHHGGHQERAQPRKRHPRGEPTPGQVQVAEHDQVGEVRPGQQQAPGIRYQDADDQQRGRARASTPGGIDEHRGEEDHRGVEVQHRGHPGDEHRGTAEQDRVRSGPGRQSVPEARRTGRRRRPPGRRGSVRPPGRTGTTPGRSPPGPWRGRPRRRLPPAPFRRWSPGPAGENDAPSRRSHCIRVRCRVSASCHHPGADRHARGATTRRPGRRPGTVAVRTPWARTGTSRRRPDRRRPARRARHAPATSRGGGNVSSRLIEGPPTQRISIWSPIRTGTGLEQGPVPLRASGCTGGGRRHPRRCRPLAHLIRPGPGRADRRRRQVRGSGSAT